MENIKLIASDLDGTLLIGRDTLKEETLSLIKEVTGNGIVFAVASGRQYENLRDLFKPIHNDIAYICYNGGLCIYRGEVLYENYMNRPLARQIIRDIESTKSSRAMVSVRGCEMIADKDESFYRHMTGFVKAKTQRTDHLPDIDEDIFKVALYNADGKLNAAYWEEKYKGRCEVLTSGNVWLDFIPYASDKGTTLKKFAQALRITPKEILAFGDNDNDISMLEFAGTPVVMNTARDRIKQYGAFCTDTVDETLKKLI